MACGFHVSSVFAPASGLRVAGTSHRGGRRLVLAPPLAKLHFLQRRRSRALLMGDRARAADPSSDPREAFPGTLQATRGSLQALIGGVPVQAGFSSFREMVLQKWIGCLAGHWGEVEDRQILSKIWE